MNIPDKYKSAYELGKTRGKQEQINVHKVLDAGVREFHKDIRRAIIGKKKDATWLFGLLGMADGRSEASPDGTTTKGLFDDFAQTLRSQIERELDISLEDPPPHVAPPSVATAAPTSLVLPPVAAAVPVHTSPPAPAAPTTPAAAVAAAPAASVTHGPVVSSAAAPAPTPAPAAIISPLLAVSRAQLPPAAPTQTTPAIASNSYAAPSAAVTTTTGTGTTTPTQKTTAPWKPINNPSPDLKTSQAKAARTNRMHRSGSMWGTVMRNLGIQADKKEDHADPAAKSAANPNAPAGAKTTDPHAKTAGHGDAKDAGKKNDSTAAPAAKDAKGAKDAASDKKTDAGAKKEEKKDEKTPKVPAAS